MRKVGEFYLEEGAEDECSSRNSSGYRVSGRPERTDGFIIYGYHWYFVHISLLGLYQYRSIREVRNPVETNDNGQLLITGVDDI
jgi:hypothetical protein